MTIKVHLVKAFTKDVNAGNPAGVVLEEDKLSNEQMMFISNEVGFSETAFVVKGVEKDVYRVRFFTPTSEVPLCGHATIAAFSLLLANGYVDFDGTESVQAFQQTMAGKLGVERLSDGKVIMNQSLSKFLSIEKDIDKVAYLLGLGSQEILNFPLQNVSTGGVPKMMIPVKSFKSLRSIQPKFTAIREYCERTECRGLYPFTSDVIEKGNHFHARQFNPSSGVDEDPITGVAAGALGCYVNKYGIIQEKELVVEQGYLLGNGGKMYVDIRNGVRVGGYGVVYGERQIGG